jgi:hypothetical protein
VIIRLKQLLDRDGRFIESFFRYKCRKSGIAKCRDHRDKRQLSMIFLFRNGYYP